MGTKTTQTNTNQYTGQATKAQNTLSQTYNSMVQNPYGGQAYNMGLQQNMGAANQLSANNVSNAMQNYNMSGGGNLTGGARASLLSGLSRQSSGLRQQGFFNNWNTATANQQFGANVLGNQSTQLAGTTSTTQKSGVGTWLPQVLGGALSFFTGGLLGGKGGGGNSPASQSPAQMQSVWNSGAMTNPLVPTGGLGPMGQGAPGMPNQIPGAIQF